MSSVFCKKIKKFLENFQKTLQKCKSKYKCVGSFVKKCLKIAALSSRHGVSASPRGGIDPSFWAQRGVRFLSGSEINTGGCLAFKRRREIFFLLSAKGSENAQGEFSEFPPGNPKTPHTPTNEKRSAELSFAPLSKGARGIVSKRTNMGTSARQKTRRR